MLFRSETPLIRERIAMVRRRLGFHPGSYSDKMLIGFIEWAETPGEVPPISTFFQDVREVIGT